MSKHERALRAFSSRLAGWAAGPKNRRMTTIAAARHKTVAIHYRHVHRNRQASAHGAGIEQLLIHGAIELLVIVAAAGDLFRISEVLPVAG
jgi:hypothetical protein